MRGECVIEVEITEHGIMMEGHAGYFHDGCDRVCAAISALTCNLINSIQELTDNRIRADTENGKTEIEWDCLSEKGKLLVDSWLLGISAINQQYGCIKFL